MAITTTDLHRRSFAPSACRPVRLVGLALLALLLVVPGAASADAAQDSSASPDPAAPRDALSTAPSASPTQRGLQTVVIDPGHGGSETGAVGPGGISEKAIVLDVARRLRDLIIRQLGLQVILTRDDDRDVPLDRRTELANNFKADLFVSIHANAYRGRGVRGPETYFLSDRASDDDARRLAGIENDTIGLEESAPGDDGLQLLLWDMAQTLHLRESSVLAETIQQRLNGVAGITDRGVKQAPFRVLRGAMMPAVLVELGFITNPDEERLLADPGYRQQLAEALFQSISDFRRRQQMLTGNGPGR